MDDFRPIVFTWTEDGVMKPLHHFTRTCDKQFVVGVEYRMVVEEDRSMASHRRYFACLREAWRNLPENLVPLFPDPEKLRKWVLVKCNYADVDSMVCESPLDAVHFAYYIGKTVQDAIVVQKGRVIHIYTPKSQSTRSMNKQEFLESSNAVLDYVSTMISTSRADLEANADQAA